MTLPPDEYAPLTDDLVCTLERLPEDPIWRQVALDVVALFSRGEIIPKEWLDAHLMVPSDAGLLTVEQHRGIQLDRMQKREGLKAVLLLEHRRLLIAAPGVGFRIIPAPEQTKVAQSRHKKRFVKNLKQAINAVAHVELSLLGPQGLQENETAKVKLTWLLTLSRKQLGYDK